MIVTAIINNKFYYLEKTIASIFIKVTFNCDKLKHTYAFAI